MTRNDGYASPGAVESAISAAARKASNTDPSLTIQERIRLEYFHRFLSRLFSEENDSNWMLKGGAGMLARVASARTTTDVDVFRRSASLDAALEDLRRLAAIDLSDFFRFDYVGHSTAVDGNQQTYAEGYRVSFDVYVGAKRKDRLSVDLVVNIITTDVVDIRLPANALDLPRLPSHPYRLYPVVDQVADTAPVSTGRDSGTSGERCHRHLRDPQCASGPVRQPLQHLASAHPLDHGGIANHHEPVGRPGQPDVEPFPAAVAGAVLVEAEHDGAPFHAFDPSTWP